MMYAGKAPWHGLGTPVETEVTAGAALKLAGLDWTVEKRALFTRGRADIDGIPVIGEPINSHCAVVRTTDDRILGVVGHSYEPIQNEEAFAFLDALVGEGLAMFHTAGSLFGGRRIFVCCKLPDAIQVGPDQVDKYLVAVSGHDRTMAFTVKWSPIRVVCWNTASAAFGIRDDKVTATDCVSIWHTRNWRKHAAQAREVLHLTDLYYGRVEECFQRLVATPFRDSDFTTFAKKLLPDGKRDDGTPIDRTKVRDTLKYLFRQGIGQDHPDVRNTRWAAYNAVTEYVDHVRGNNAGEADGRMRSVMWGNGAQLKKRALDMLSVG